MNHERTPLLEALISHKKKAIASYHVPGHKNGTVVVSGKDSYFQKILEIDATELNGLDDLHDAGGCIQEAQRLAANFYHVQTTCFLVNGSTVGNLGMIMGVCKENDIVIVQRNCHKSIIHALKLAGAKPIFLPTMVDKAMQVSLGVQVDSALDALEKYQNAKAIILSNPNYYGHSVDLSVIIDKAHDYGIPVLVDEAHGAHFSVSSDFPKSAIEMGADVIVQSAHKTLPAMTMGSYLHINSSLVDASEIKAYLSMLQSSSPSYPIMASLDIARHYAATLEKQDIEGILEHIEQFKEEITKIVGLEVVCPRDCSIKVDPLKITIANTLGLSGYELQAILETGGIFTEMADPLHVLLVLPLYKQEKVGFIIEKMRSLLSSYEIKKLCSIYEISDEEEASVLPYSYKELAKMKKEVIFLDDARGKVAAEMIIPYPPGIPIIIEGEIITQEKIENMKWLQQQGARFQRGKNREHHKIEVYT